MKDGASSRVSPGASGRDPSRLPTVRTLDELAGLVTGGPDEMFLRYSHGPDADAHARSVDHESGLELPGLSVTVLDPPSWWTRPVTDWLARQVRKYAQLGEEPGRHAWVLTGRVTARGPDHEPLVDDGRALAFLSDELLTEAAARYEERFDRGRDSRGRTDDD